MATPTLVLFVVTGMIGLAAAALLIALTRRTTGVLVRQDHGVRSDQSLDTWENEGGNAR